MDEQFFQWLSDLFRRPPQPEPLPPGNDGNNPTTTDTIP